MNAVSLSMCTCTGANGVLLDYAASYEHIVCGYQSDVTMHVLRPLLQ